MNKLKIILSILMLLFGACKQNASTQVNNSVKVSLSVINVDLDTCINEKANFDEVFITHKNFDKIGDTDTLQIADNIFSIKTAKYITGNDDAELCLSQLEIFYKNQKVFSKDSILTTGMYFYEKSKDLLTIPVIINQNSDNLSTETVLYICDLTNGEIKKINGVLVNSSFALICCDASNLLFNNGDKLLLHNLQTNKEQVIYNFDNPLLSIFNLSLKGDCLEIYYFKDFANDIANDVPMNKAKIKLSKEICKN
jgi:hypothetical protein